MEEKKKGHTTAIIAAVVCVSAFISALIIIPKEINAFMNDTKSIFESKTTYCNRYASIQATKSLQTQLSILQEKENPTPSDLATIEQYQGILDRNATLREDNNYYYTKCMR